MFELKNPADANANIQSAFNQIQTYKSEIPSLFAFNEICVLIDHVKNALAGTISSDTDRFVGWKSVDGKKLAKINDLKTLIEGIFTKEKLLDIIRNFIVFESEKDSKNNVNKILKKLAAYHQYFAVNNAVEKTRTAASLNGDRRAGVVWHTQGAGKSLSMVFYASKIIQVLDNPTVVLLTDRNDLDGQLYSVFSHCSDIICQITEAAVE
ncbi:MAG: type I restriction endonuclease subunit R [Nitrospirae bacterium]|nr:type I restriction endonuclease subunit R [Nitrospirota bacterium]